MFSHYFKSLNLTIMFSHYFKSLKLTIRFNHYFKSLKLTIRFNLYFKSLSLAITFSHYFKSLNLIIFNYKPKRNARLLKQFKMTYFHLECQNPSKTSNNVFLFAPISLILLFKPLEGIFVI
jgi:hypothetical protein